MRFFSYFPFSLYLVDFGGMEDGDVDSVVAFSVGEGGEGWFVEFDADEGVGVGFGGEIWEEREERHGFHLGVWVSWILPCLSVGGGYGEGAWGAICWPIWVGVGDIEALLDMAFDVGWVVAGDGLWSGPGRVVGLRQARSTSQ